VLPRAFKRQLATDRFIRIPSQFTDQYIILITQVFNELLSHETIGADDQQKQQLLVCLATTMIDNILPDSTMDLQFDDDQCKTPNER
jgi:hypothetical protein